MIEIKEKKPELPKVDSLKFKLLLGLIRSNSSILRSVYRYLSFLNSLPIKGKKKKEVNRAIYRKKCKEGEN